MFLRQRFRARRNCGCCEKRSIPRVCIWVAQDDNSGKGEAIVNYDIELNSAAHYPVRGIVELSPLIEQAGFGAFWKGESNSTDPFVLISAIGARTNKLKLGTAIYQLH